MRTLLFLLQKEFIQLGRDKSILLILFMITLVMLFIVPPAAKVEVSEIALCVVDHDRTTTSKEFLRKLTSANQFVVGAYVDSYEEALAVLEKNQTSGILEIPKGFEKHLMEGSVAPIMLEIDAVNGVTAGLTSFYFLQIVAQYIWEYIDGIGFQQGFKIASQEEIMAQVEAQAQAELMKRAKAEQAAQAELSHKQTVANARLEAEQERVMAEAMADVERMQQMQTQAEAQFQAAQAQLARAQAELGQNTLLGELPAVRVSSAPGIALAAKIHDEAVVGEPIVIPPMTIQPSSAEVVVPALEKADGLYFEQVNMIVNNRYNPDGESSLYQIPSLLAILVCVIGTVLSALNIVMEKENGTIEQMNVSPVRRSVFIISKIVPSWVIGMAVFTLGILIVWLFYGITPRGSYLSIYLLTFLFLVAMVGFGIWISAMSRNQQQAMLLCFFFLLVFCLLCGLWTPIDSMPWWAQIIADINPLRYYIETMRLFYAYGSELRHVVPHIGTLLVFIVVYNGLAIWNFRKAQ